MFVAQARLDVHLAEAAAVLYESRSGQLVDAAVVICHKALGIMVAVDAVGVGIFTPKGKIAFPQRATQHQLGGMEAIAVAVIGMNGALATEVGCLVRLLHIAAESPEAIGIEVDAPLPDATIVVTVEDVLGFGR